MNEPVIHVSTTKRITRPLDVVRAHFFDFDRHNEKRVHKGVRFKVLHRAEDRCHFTQEVRLLGTKQIDEAVLVRQSDRRLVQDFVSGSLSGSRLVLSFSPEGESATRLDATLSVPATGLKRAFSPVLRVLLQKLGDKALEEDRVDLELAGYQTKSSPTRS